MTGDGVNDAPALRDGRHRDRDGPQRHRRGPRGADIVLLDDNFASIAAAVEEGRAVYDNIRRFAQYHFSSNVAELFAFLDLGPERRRDPAAARGDAGAGHRPRHRPAAGDRARHGAAGAGRDGATAAPALERLLNLRVLGRVYGFVGLLVGVAGLTSFLAGYLLAGWRPGEALADSGALYVQATAMTYAGIVAGQVGAGFAFRTTPVRFIVGAALEPLPARGHRLRARACWWRCSTCRFQDAFHMAPLDPRVWLLLAIWPVRAGSRGGAQGCVPPLGVAARSLVKP